MSLPITPYRHPETLLPERVVIDEDLVRDVRVAGQAVAAMTSITDEAQCSVGRDVLVAVNALAKQVETQREAAKRPYLDAGKAIDKAAKTVSDPLNKMIAHVKGKLADYAMVVERQRQEAAAEQTRRELAAEQEAKATGRTPELVLSVEIPEAAAITTRKVPEVEILDLNLIPREFFVLDQAKLKAALIGGADVPGAKLIHKLSVVSR